MSAVLAITSATVRPRGARRSRSRAALIQGEFGRRAFLRGLIVLAGAAALSSFDFIVTRYQAWADPPTHDQCSDYTSWDNGWWKQCNPRASQIGGGNIGNSNIGAEFCNDNNYHRQDFWTNNANPPQTYVTIDYSQRDSSCQNKNAWVWKINLTSQGMTNGKYNWQNKRSRRCSDGRYVKTTNTFNPSHTTEYRSNSVCEHRLPNGDPDSTSDMQYNKYTPDGCPPDDGPNDPGC